VIAALYIDPARGPYASMPDVDAWGIERDAMTYAGPLSVVAHPPCGPWGQLSWRCSNQDPACAVRAVEQLREFGGVLEHPAGSRLWAACNLPRPGEIPRRGFWSMEVDQVRWGHPCRKRSWLLFCGISPHSIGALPPMRQPTHVIDSSRAQKRAGVRVRHLPKSRRHLTPPAFARWLVDIAAAHGGT